jgi:hypothetical protein
VGQFAWGGERFRAVWTAALVFSVVLAVSQLLFVKWFMRVLEIVFRGVYYVDCSVTEVFCHGVVVTRKGR